MLRLGGVWRESWRQPLRVVPRESSGWLAPFTSRGLSTPASPSQSKKPLFSLEKQRLLLQVVEGVHNEAGRPNTTSIKALFQVPARKPFPEELHGMRFPVTSLRHEKRLGRLDPDIVAKFDAMGFVWDVGESQWNETKVALTKYKEIFGNLLVHVHYAVPSGNSQVPPARKKWLDEMGFVWDATEANWHVNLLALETYQKVHGNLTVAKAYVVPTEDPQWPKEVWGLKLGNLVRTLRNRASGLSPHKLDALNAMGFVWKMRERGAGPSPPAQFSLEKQHQIVEILKFQRTLQPHTKFVTVPNRFIVPSEAPWPRHLQARVVQTSKFRRAYIEGGLDPMVVNDLDGIGFVWNNHSHQWAVKIEALARYKALHGDLLVGGDFLVPDHDSRWPVFLWGKKLGVVVFDLRSGRDKLSPDQRDELDAMGFVWDAMADQWQLNLLGLQAFKALHGHLNIPRAFVVPVHDATWPEDVWALPLGNVVSAIRSGRTKPSPERRQALDKLGFVWHPLEDLWNRKMDALETYRRLHGHIKIPNAYVVPDRDAAWAPELWNMKLGLVLQKIRLAGRQDRHPPHRVDQLRALGIV
ncbi:hypothetical protein DYB32_006022 [Aphanomyces invadans]|uniref:Helicase-associated domain-containing protein n=1 Tax=Aphanomyces invadans TaxID=157072 RepID=A0A3R6VVK4_9STRA|nr:hypothetical protein DYB32_006022 [Aphanomyces invadans]